MKVYEYISNRLKENGCKRAFGVPGSYIKPLWQNIDIPMTLCVHEGDAGYIASAYAKKAKELVLVLVTSSPGVTNSISGIASSFRDSTSVIMISGTTPTKLRKKGAFQEESDYDRAFYSINLTNAITKKSFIIENVNDVQMVLTDAIKAALTDRKGPVHISIPVDIQEMEMSDDKFSYKYSMDRNISNHSYKFDKSLIIIGGGCNNYEVVKKIYEFSEKISAPIISSMKGMSYLYEGDYVLGSVGMGSNYEVIDFIKKYEPKNIYCFGTSLSVKDFSNINGILEKSNKYIFSLEDTYADKFTNYYHFKTNNLKVIVQELIDKSSVINNENKETIKDLNYKINKRLKENIKNSLMSRCIYYIMNNVDKETIITSDAGNHYLDTISCFNARNFETFFIDAGLAAMGNGICSVVGFSLVTPGKRCISITGDGCALMNGNSIYTAKSLNLPIIFIVTNNSSLGRVRLGQQESKKFISTDINNVDFKKYGESFNIKSFSADNYDDFVNAFNSALKYNETILIEIKCDKNEKPIVFM